LSQEGKAKHSNRYAFSGKIKCGGCHSSYVARYKKRKDGSQYKSWRCFERTRNGAPHIDKAGNHIGCNGESIRNGDAMYIMQLVMNSLNCEKDSILSNLLSAIENVISNVTLGLDIENWQSKISKTEEKQKRLLDLYMSDDITKGEFIEARDKCYAEIKGFQDLIDSVDKQHRPVNEGQTLMRDIRSALAGMMEGASQDDEFYRNILNKMVIHSCGYVDIHLNFLSHKWRYAIEKPLAGHNRYK
jgi:flagellin-specific chaperone FliS